MRYVRDVRVDIGDESVSVVRGICEPEKRERHGHNKRIEGQVKRLHEHAYAYQGKYPCGRADCYFRRRVNKQGKDISGECAQEEYEQRAFLSQLRFDGKPEENQHKDI